MKDNRILEIEYRLRDVYKLMSSACQDFLKLIVEDGWQLPFCEFVEREVNGKYGNTYKEAYRCMRSKGPQKYTVDDMDVTIIAAFVFFSKVVNTKEDTRKALARVRDDKNSLQSHINGNESPENLYLRALLALVNLRDFVEAVESEEIEVNARTEYWTKYVERINSLIETLDEERIVLIQKNKEYNQKIQTVLASNNPENEWIRVFDVYWAMSAADKSNREWMDFAVKASDAGIPFAHSYAANCFYFSRDYLEYERRIARRIQANEIIHNNEAQDIINRINRLLMSKEISISEETKAVVDGLIKQGYHIIEEEGLYKFLS